MDGTHDVSKEKMKLLGVGAVGTHWAEKHCEWMSTMIPLAFALAHEETKESFTCLLKFAKRVLFEMSGVDLVECVDSIYVDGAPELKHIADTMFQQALFRRCVQHVKNRIQFQVGGGIAWELKKRVDLSAFIPNDFVFHLYWKTIVERLRLAGASKAVNHLLKNVLQQGPGGYWAAWQSGYSHVQPGRSTYTPNVIEAFWKYLDLLGGDEADHEAAGKLFEQMTGDLCFKDSYGI